jgi:hypothetical protein
MVFRGVINGNTIDGERADVLAAHEDANAGHGTLKLSIIGPSPATTRTESG